MIRARAGLRHFEHLLTTSSARIQLCGEFEAHAYYARSGSNWNALRSIGTSISGCHVVTQSLIESGSFNSLALRSDGAIVAWGWNAYGQCTVPALPAGLAYVDVAAGFDHRVAWRSDGAVVGRGNNASGQCNVPMLPAGLKYVGIAAGYAETVAVADGSCPDPFVYCTAKTNSCGLLPAIAFTGSPHAGATTGFTISTTGARAGTNGLLLYSPNGAANFPFQGGTLCVAPHGLKRSPQVAAMGGTGGAVFDAVFSIDWAAFSTGNLGGNPPPFLNTLGQRVNVQWGARQPRRRQLAIGGNSV